MFLLYFPGYFTCSFFGVGQFKNCHGVIYRCHPNYRGGLNQKSRSTYAWFDWCGILYDSGSLSNDSDSESDDEPKGIVYPGRLLFIVEYDNVITGDTEVRMIAEVAKAEVRPKTLLTGVFELVSKPGKRDHTGKQGRRLPVYYNISTESLCSTCLCIPSYGNDDDSNWDKITYIRPANEWSSIFTGDWSGTKGVPCTGIRHAPNSLLRCSFQD